jgi:hypothetical protein
LLEQRQQQQYWWWCGAGDDDHGGGVVIRVVHCPGTWDLRTGVPCPARTSENHARARQYRDDDDQSCCYYCPQQQQRDDCVECGGWTAIRPRSQ